MRLAAFSLLAATLTAASTASAQFTAADPAEPDAVGSFMNYQTASGIFRNEYMNMLVYLVPVLLGLTIVWKVVGKLRRG